MSKRIFISYSSKDRAIASHIANELECRGAEVFIDYEGLAGGDNFIATIGSKIEASDVMVLLFSPRSEQSKWVRAEVAWAFNKDVPIIPAILEPASMTNFFFLIDRDYVDFKRWFVDGDVSEATAKLVRSLGLPTDCITMAVSVPPPDDRPHHPPDPSQEPRADPLPAFAIGDLSDLFQKAVNIRGSDPEQTVYLYQEILQTDPNFMGGQIEDFVVRELVDLNPRRLVGMLVQAEDAMGKGQWSRAGGIAEDMLKLDESHIEAQHIKAICFQNMSCEPIYQQAQGIAENGGIGLVRLYNYIKSQCPDYGDPAGIFSFPITVKTAPYIGLLAEFQGHSARVRGVAFRPDGRILASVSDDTNLILWDMETRQKRTTLTGHSESVYGVAFSPDKRILASASLDQTIILWDSETGQNQATFTGHSNSISNVAFSPDGQTLASASLDQTIILWDIETRQMTTTLIGHSGTVWDVAFSPDGQTLASVSHDRTIILWNAETGQRQVTFTGHSDSVESIAFSPDGWTLASASRDKNLILWDVGTGQIRTILNGHSNYVLGAEFSPDGRTLASASFDKTLIIWDVVTGQIAHTLTGHLSNVNDVTFSPDGRLLASGGQDGIVRLWGVG